MDYISRRGFPRRRPHRQLLQITDVDQFFADADGLFEHLDSVKPAPGFLRVTIPGEPEAEQRVRLTGDGINVTGLVWEQITRIAAESQVNLDDLWPGGR
jgi:LDH2 family malate/lactate/ureidoglycolate dehydrogenase